MVQGQQDLHPQPWLYIHLHTELCFSFNKIPVWAHFLITFHLPEEGRRLKQDN